MIRMRQFAASALATGLLSVTLAAPAQAFDPGWTHPGYGAGNSFYNPNESIVNAASIDDIGVQWTAKLPTVKDYSCSGPSAPLVAGGRVFVTDETGIGAYRAATGAPLWHFAWSLPDNENTPHMALSGGLLLAGNTECQSQSDPGGGIIALDVATGRKRWSVSVGGPVESLVVDRGTVVVAGSSESSEPAVSAYRVSDGTPRWTVPGYWSAGVSADGKLLVSGAEEQGIAALSTTTGKTLWHRPWLLTAVAATPAGEAFYLADDDGGLVCIRSSNGARMWARNGTGGPIATDGRRVYRGFSNSIEALDARTGAMVWSARLGAEVGQPVRAGGLLYTTVEDAGLTILSAATGARATRWPFAAVPSYHVVVAGGRIFQLDGNALTAYAPAAKSS